MKAVKLLFVVFFLLLTLVPSFSEQRNLSTPLSRLWGHWLEVETGNHYYFAKVTKPDEQGSRITVKPDKAKMVKDFKRSIAKKEGKEREFTQVELAYIENEAGKAKYGWYKLLSQEPNGMQVIIQTEETLSGTGMHYEYRFLIEKNGSTMQEVSSSNEVFKHLKYIDSKTTPEG